MTSRPKSAMITFGPPVPKSNAPTLQQLLQSNTNNTAGEMPVGVQTINHNLPKPRALVFSDRLKFSDYSETSLAFNVPEGSILHKNEKILMDNIWAAMKTKNDKHLITTLNGFCLYFTEKNREESVYVVYNGPQPGIYRTWPQVISVTKHKDSKFKKYRTYAEAFGEASRYLTKFFITQELRESSSNSSKIIPGQEYPRNEEIYTLKKQNLKLQADLLEKENQNNMLMQKIDHLSQAQRVFEMSYAGAGLVAEEGRTKEDEIMENLPSSSKKRQRRQDNGKTANFI